MKQIPVELLRDRTRSGLQVSLFKTGDVPADKAALLGAHRDDHYIFFVLMQGQGSVAVDFQEMKLPEHSLYFVLPAQVHERIYNKAASGWFIAVDTALVPPECRNVFEGRLQVQQPYVLNTAQLKQCNKILTVLSQKFAEKEITPFYNMAVHSLLGSFLAMAADYYCGDTGPHLKVSRPAQLTARFKKLLHSEIRSVKSPAGFAARLHVSESYLNEVLKKTTGFPISYWIHQEVILEAKRLLYYSELTVKEIADHLGYNDYSYFSRLFRKVEGISPREFRQRYREKPC